MFALRPDLFSKFFAFLSPLCTSCHIFVLLEHVRLCSVSHEAMYSSSSFHISSSSCCLLPCMYSNSSFAAWRVEVVPRRLKSLALLTLERSSRVQTGPAGFRQRSVLLRGELVLSIGVPPMPSFSVFSCSGDTIDIGPPCLFLRFLNHNVVQWTAARYVFDKCRNQFG